MRYDDPDCTIRREASFETAAGAAAVSAKFMQFRKMRLKAVHGIVTVAGTSAAAGNCVIVKSGTTTFGTMTFGSSTAGVAATSLTGLNATIESLIPVTCTNGTDATGKALVNYEYEILPDAVEST